jgi:hypothetical protein
VSVNKLSVVLLTVLLALSIISVGHAEAKALFEQRPAEVNAASPGSVSSSPHSDGLDSLSFPTDLDIMILALSFVRTQETYWVRATDYQRQIDGITRARGGGTLLGTGHGYKFGLHKQSKLAIPILYSESLSSSSPPGLVLRL